MAFVHGHARETGWVVSHYRRPQVSGDGQLPLPSPRPPDDGADPVRGLDAVGPEAEAEVDDTVDVSPGARGGP